MKAHMHRAGQRGFTLVEAIIVIVIMGIVGGMVGIFIAMPVRGFQDSAARAELTDIADLALRRMARDIRLAVPNSVRVNAAGTAIEFLQTKTGGRYLAVEDDATDATLQPLDFLNAGHTSFMMIGDLPTGKQAIVPGSDYVVVNNLGIAPVNAYQYVSGGTTQNIARISSVSGGVGLQTITMESNPFAAQNPPMPSPSARFQVVSGPVSYYCAPASAPTTGDGSLRRQWNYPISAAQQVPAVAGGRSNSASGAQDNYIARHIQSCTFKYEDIGGASTSTRTGLLHMKLELYLPETGLVSVSHQIHVDNTP
jgi:MSHA biogenesis protein MshO